MRGARRLLAVGLCAAAASSTRLAAAAAVEESTPEVPPPPTTVEKPARHGSAFVDPLGFALFGPRLGLELGAGHISGAAHARWFNQGVLSRSLFLNEGDELAFSYAVGLRARYYLPEGLTGLHIGLAAEYLHVRVEQPSALIATVSSYFVPYAEGGYRWSFGPAYVDAAAGLGYALRASGKVENLPGGSAAGGYVARDESSFYGTASLDLGIFF